MSNQKKYRVWEDDGDPPDGYTRLTKLETDSIIEAVSYQHKNGRCDGIMVWLEDIEGWTELDQVQINELFFTELKDLLSNGKDMEIQRLMGDAFTPPPPEFLQFMRKNFTQHQHPLFAICNPYAPVITVSGDTSNLVLTSISKVEPQ